jgi:hypothetical protein
MLRGTLEDQADWIKSAVDPDCTSSRDRIRRAGVETLPTGTTGLFGTVDTQTERELLSQPVAM